MPRKILLFLLDPLSFSKRRLAGLRRFAISQLLPWNVTIFLILSVFCWTPVVQGDEFRSDDRFFQQLAQPISLVLEGKSFRATIEKVAQQTDVNVWMDRRVDPSVLVAPGLLGPNVYAALAKVAGQQKCVVMPVANVVLIGREAWVDATATSLLKAAKTTPRINLNWPELSTPREALSIATELQPAEVLALPHDLWPAVSLKSISRGVAVNLVLAQFGRRLESVNQVDLATTVPLSKQSEPTLRTYTNDASLVAAAKSLTPPPAVKSQQPIAALKLTTQQHRLLAAALLEEFGKQNVAPMRSIDERTFESLKFEDVKVAGILNHLADVANMKCIFAPEAQAISQRIISLDVKDKTTLRRLIEIVADKGGLQVEWGQDDFQLSPKTP